jgi:hypothetical protein
MAVSSLLIHRPKNVAHEILASHGGNHEAYSLSVCDAV